MAASVAVASVANARSAINTMAMLEEGGGPRGEIDPTHRELQARGYLPMFPETDDQSKPFSLVSWYLVDRDGVRVHRITHSRSYLNTKPTCVFVNGILAAVIPLRRMPKPIILAAAAQQLHMRFIRSPDACRARKFIAFQIAPLGENPASRLDADPESSSIGGLLNCALVSNTVSIGKVLFCSFSYFKPIDADLFVDGRSVSKDRELSFYIQTGCGSACGIVLLLFIPFLIYVFLLVLSFALYFIMCRNICCRDQSVDRRFCLPASGPGYVTVVDGIAGLPRVRDDVRTPVLAALQNQPAVGTVVGTPVAGIATAPSAPNSIGKIDDPKASLMQNQH